MHKKITKTILLVTLIVLLIGITSAATITDNSTTNKVTKNTNTAPHPEVQKSNEKAVENKIIKKEKNKTVKSSSYITNVSNSNQLFDKIEEVLNTNYTNCTINLKKGNYNVTRIGFDLNKYFYDEKTQQNIKRNSTLKCIIIEGNGITINGQNKYMLGSVNEGYTLILKNVHLANFTSNLGAYWGGKVTTYNCTYSKNVKNYEELLEELQCVEDTDYTTNYIINLEKGNYAITERYTLNYPNNEDYQTLTINGNNQIFDGKNEHGFLKINSNLWKVYLNDLTFKNCDYDNSDGVIENQASIYLNNCKFINNTNTWHQAAGIFTSPGATTYVNNSYFENNRASWSSGAIFGASDSKLTIINSKFINNTASCGGAIAAYSSTIKIDKSVFESNKVAPIYDFLPKIEGDGGAIYSDYDTTLEITNSKFINNTATKGGAIKDEDASVIIINNIFENNSASTLYGSAIHLDNCWNNITKNIFRKNPTNTTIGKPIGSNEKNNQIYDNINENRSIYTNTLYLNGGTNNIYNNTF